MSIPLRDLRNNSATVLQRVQRGESLVVTKDGEPIAEVVPLKRQPFSKESLLELWAHLPRVDSARLRREVDELMD